MSERLNVIDDVRRNMIIVFRRVLNSVWRVACGAARFAGREIWDYLVERDVVEVFNIVGVILDLIKMFG